MAKKIYAVRAGKKTGLFTTWEECKANVLNTRLLKSSEYFGLMQSL